MKKRTLSWLLPGVLQRPGSGLMEDAWMCPTCEFMHTIMTGQSPVLSVPAEAPLSSSPLLLCFFHYALLSDIACPFRLEVTKLLSLYGSTPKLSRQ